MKVTMENIGPCRRKLAVEVPADEVDREWRDALDEFRKYAQLPGFRAGRVPVAMLERRFAKEITEEVRRRLLPQYFREAIAKEKLQTVGMPDLGAIHLEKGAPFTFQVTVDIAPEFALPAYSGLKVNRRAASVKDEEVEAGILALAEQQATFEEVDARALALGDFAVISYTSACDGKPLAEITPKARALSENAQFWLRMDRDAFLPGFCEALVGAAKGDRRQVLVDFPADFRIPELGGKKATYFVEVLGLKERKLPALDDAFAKSLQIESLDQLKAKVRENLQAAAEERAEAEVREQVVEQLLKAAAFDLPETLVAANIRQTMYNIVRENAARGVEPAELREKGKEIHDFAHKRAEERVKLAYILLGIAKAEKIEVKDDELEREIERLARQAGRPIGKFREEIQERGADESLREQMLTSRALDRVIALASLQPA